MISRLLTGLPGAQSSALLILLCISELTLATVAHNPFPRPAELEADIQFWTRVYTEIGTTAGFIHDARHLSIIYEQIEFETDTTRRKRERIVASSKTKYARILAKLATGNRDRLTTEAQRVLSLWPQDVSREQLKDAAKNLRFQLGQADRFLAGLERSGQWLQDIQQILESHEIPAQLAVLPHIESSYNPGAHSYRGASGLWQFTRSTGKLYLRIDRVVDERLDPIKSTTAAAELLKDNLDVTGTWPLAITAYNHGAKGMRRAIRQTNGNDIAKIVREYKSRSFGFASRNFYIGFLAAIDVVENANSHFGEFEFSQPPPLLSLRTEDFFNAHSLAQHLGIEHTVLQQHNPALRSVVWQGVKYIPRGFILKIPKNLLLGSPSKILTQIPVQDRFQFQRQETEYKVARGDSLSTIAAQYGTSVSVLTALNDLSSKHMIRVGQTLKLPLAEQSNSEKFGETNTPSVTAEKRQSQTARLATSTTTSVSAANLDRYSVDSNRFIKALIPETIGHYANWLGLSSSVITELNNIKNQQSLLMGQKLRLDFSRVTAQLFEQRRREYHTRLREQFFARHRITNVIDYTVQVGDSLWTLANNKYGIPIWLLQNYNPGFDFENAKIGGRLKIPQVNRITASNSTAETS